MWKITVPEGSGIQVCGFLDMKSGLNCVNNLSSIQFHFSNTHATQGSVALIPKMESHNVCSLGTAVMAFTVKTLGVPRCQNLCVSVEYTCVLQILTDLYVFFELLFSIE